MISNYAPNGGIHDLKFITDQNGAPGTALGNHLTYFQGKVGTLRDSKGKVSRVFFTRFFETYATVKPVSENNVTRKTVLF